MKKIVVLVLLLMVVLGSYVALEKKPFLCEATFNGKHYRCSFGVSGVTTNKQEGDGATPIGDFPIRLVYYRPDRVQGLTSALPLIAMQPETGWCDDPKTSYYNREIREPFEGSHETLWRADNVYDIVAVIGYNDAPIVKGKGSAIFMHIARAGYTPTAGCIALAENDLKEIIKGLSASARIKIDAKGKVTIYNP